jgi:hypothetical protein
MPGLRLLYKITIRAMADGPDKPGKAAHLAGIAAAAAWGLFLPAQAYSAILMPTAGAVFVFWLLVWQIVRTENAPSRWRCLVFGLLIGFTAMGVATILFLIPLFLIALFVRQNHRALTAKGTAAVLLIMGVFIGTSSCWLHNYFVARDPVFFPRRDQSGWEQSGRPVTPLSSCTGQARRADRPGQAAPGGR